MNKLGKVVMQYCEGMILKDEMNEILARYSIYGVVEGRNFTGYDYENQVWIELHFGLWKKNMKNLQGPDVSIEISLKKYGLVWKTNETETRFYYGVHHDNGEYTCFDWADMKNNLDLHCEYDWVNFGAVARFAGMSLEKWDEMPLAHKIWDLQLYHGIEKILGNCIIESMTYEEVLEQGN